MKNPLFFYITHFGRLVIFSLLFLTALLAPRSLLALSAQVTITAYVPEYLAYTKNNERIEITSNNPLGAALQKNTDGTFLVTIKY